MKTWILLLIIFISTSAILCTNRATNHQPEVTRNQENESKEDQEYLLYVGVKNKMKLDFSVRECEKTDLSTTNGYITDKSGCEFSLVPDTVGVLRFKLSLHDSGIYLVHRDTFSVLPIPEPIPQFGKRSITDSVISRAEIRGIPGIHITTSDRQFRYKYSVNRFRMSLFRNDSLVFTADTTSPLISEKMKGLIKTHLNEGDVVVFDSIYVKGPDDSLKLAKPLQFKTY